MPKIQDTDCNGHSRRLKPNNTNCMIYSVNIRTQVVCGGTNYLAICKCTEGAPTHQILNSPLKALQQGRTERPVGHHAVNAKCWEIPVEAFYADNSAAAIIIAWFTWLGSREGQQQSKDKVQVRNRTN